MKPHLVFLLLGLPLVTGAFAADGGEGSEAPPELVKAREAFMNLPEERRVEYGKHLEEAKRMFQEKRVLEAMDEAHQAAAIFPDGADTHNLLGSCHVELRAFDKALREFEAAAALAPGSLSIEFNIGEVLFVTKQWRKALESFRKVLAGMPAENVALGRLTEFKILLCQLKLGETREAEKLAAKYDFLDDSPFHYYANASLAYEAEDRVKAEEWLGIARRVFRNPAVLAPWQDTLVEYGYIKSFYGGDIAAEAE